MPVVSDRVRERIAEDFSAAAPRTLSALERLPIAPGFNPERVHAAVVLAARGNLSMYEDALEHAATDVRDLLDRTGLDGDDWRDMVTDEFGSDEEPTRGM